MPLMYSAHTRVTYPDEAGRYSESYSQRDAKEVEGFLPRQFRGRLVIHSRVKHTPAVQCPLEYSNLSAKPLSGKGLI